MIIFIELQKVLCYDKMYSKIYCSKNVVADAKSVWSWRKIVESSAEFLCR